MTPQTNSRFLCTYYGFLPFPFLPCFYKCVAWIAILKELKLSKRWIWMKQHEKKSSIKNEKCLTLGTFKKGLSFQTMKLFQWRRVLQNYVFAFHFNENVEVFNPIALVTISKNAWHIVNTYFYQLFVEKSHFLNDSITPIQEL